MLVRALWPCLWTSAALDCISLGASLWVTASAWANRFLLDWPPVRPHTQWVSYQDWTWLYHPWGFQDEKSHKHHSQNICSSWQQATSVKLGRREYPFPLLYNSMETSCFYISHCSEFNTDCGPQAYCLPFCSAQECFSKDHFGVMFVQSVKDMIISEHE